MRKHKFHLFGLTLLLAAGVTGGSAAAPRSVEAAAAKPLKLVVNGYEIDTGSSSPYLDGGSVYVPLRMVSELLKANVGWQASDRTVSIYAPKRAIRLTVGSKQALLNGKAISLVAPPKLKGNAVYVPIRFVAQSLGADVQWQSALRTVKIDDGDPYALGYSNTGTGSTAFWLEKQTGDLYESEPANSPAVLTGKLDFEPHEYIALGVEKLLAGEYVITVLDNFGEPHLNTIYTTAYIKDKRLADQAAVRFWGRGTQNVTRFGNQAVLSDGKTVRILKSDGSVDKSYDLQQLGGLDEVYGVEGIGKEFLLIRPNKTGLLLLVNPETGKKKALYELLDAENQQYALMNEVPYYGDTFIVYGAHDGVIELGYWDITERKKKTLTVKLADWL